MAGYVPNAFRATLMEILAGKTTLAAVTPLYLGLATAVPVSILTSTLSNITEVATAGYARAPTSAFNAAVTGTNGVVQVTNTAQFTFAAFTADMAVPARYAFLTRDATGTASSIRYIFEIVDPLRSLAGEPIVITAGNLILE